MPKAKVVSFEPSEMRRTPASDSAATVKAGTTSTLTGSRHRRADCFHRLDLGQAGRVEHVRAGLLEGLQPLDRVVEIGPAPQEILGPRGEDEIALQRPRRLDRRRDALDGLGEIVDRVARVAGMVLDRAAGQPGRLGGEDGLGGTFRAVALALLQIGRDRQIGRRDDVAAMVDHLLEADTAIGQAAREGIAGAGRGERLEADRGEQLGGADVPGIGNDEGAAGSGAGRGRSCPCPSKHPLRRRHLWTSILLRRTLRRNSGKSGEWQVSVSAGAGRAEAICAARPLPPTGCAPRGLRARRAQRRSGRCACRA